MLQLSRPKHAHPYRVASTRAWHAAFQDLPREHGFEPIEVLGNLPKDLNGTFYRNGPATYAAQGMRYRHLFDGDGGVSAVRFSNGTVTGAARLVASQGLEAERRAGKPLYPGFGTPAPSRVRWVLKQEIKNVANTNVIGWNERLFALMEAARPIELNPDTLETVGECDFNGVIRGNFSAHPHRVAARKAAYNFGVHFGIKPHMDIYEMPDVGSMRHLVRLPLFWNALVHDFAATETHLLFFIPPARLKLLATLTGAGSFADNLAWDPSMGTEIVAVPIDDPEKPIRFRVPAFYQWHFVNAFNGPGQTIVADLIRYPRWRNSLLLDSVQHAPFTEVAEGRLCRVVIEPRQKRLVTERSQDFPAEFPRVDPRREGSKARFAYMCTSSCAPDVAWDQVSKVDLETGRQQAIDFDGARDYVSEPVFAPRPGASNATDEDDGYVLTPFFSGARQCSGIAIHDAQRLDEGPLGEVFFDHLIPPTFHGNWVATS